MDYPLTYRRLRQDAAIRELTTEVSVSPKKLIQPHFVAEGLPSPEPVPGLTGVKRETPDSLLRQVESDFEKGVKKLLLFGVPHSKAESRFQFDFVADQIQNLRHKFGSELWIAIDDCLCSNTSHGQCGVVNKEGTHVENEATVTILAEAARIYSQAGADCIAPSDMMDGRVRAIREAVSENTLIMSYSCKFHSGFYGPFRVAADSAPKGEIKLKDRATYQIDPARPTDALLCARRDAEEGADILMVKPGLPYLDILKDLSQQVPLPWAVYQVSGEFAAIELMAREGLANGPRAHVETWTAFARAGAQMIITYGARHARDWLEQNT